jgi:hypothetical protein
MSIKLALIKSNEMIISNVKEIRSDDKLVAYLFNKPHVVSYVKELPKQNRINLAENQSHLNDFGDGYPNSLEPSVGDREVQISMAPWVFLTTDEDIVVSGDWIVTIMEPIDSIVEMYEEKVNGKISQ